MEKAIFKFNGGNGALLCSKCRTIIKTGDTMSQFEKDAMMGKQEMLPKYCKKCRDGIQYQLIRVDDGLMFYADSVKWIKWKKNGSFDNMFARPKVGYSCIVNPQYGNSYTWLTTSIQSLEIISKNEIRFKTKNSTYVLNKLILPKDEHKN